MKNLCASLLCSAVLAAVPLSSAAAQVAPADIGPMPNVPATPTIPAAPAYSMDQTHEVHMPEPLWPKGAPGAVGKAETDVPTLAIYLPSANPTRTFVVVAPGGGYEHLAMDHEGLQVAQWLNAHGVAAGVLKYRLGPTYHHPVELGDAQRAIRLVRSRAASLGVQPDRIGMLGFSAGGHLAATAGTLFDTIAYPAADAIDAVSARPDFLVLAYPVISMEDGTTHAGSVKYLLGDNPDAAQKKALSADEQVTARTPPTFLFSTTDDATVPVMNSVLFYAALVRNKVPAELHIFRSGRHGLGLAQTTPEVNEWPQLLYAWMHANGWAQ